MDDRCDIRILHQKNLAMLELSFMFKVQKKSKKIFKNMKRLMDTVKETELDYTLKEIA